MSSERPEEFSEQPVPTGRQASDERRAGENAGAHGPSGAGARPEAQVLVRGETIRDQEPKSPPKDKEPPRKEVSAAKIKMQSRLPALDDDSDVGIQKEQMVVRDGKADLAFTGTLLASAAPPSAPEGHWQEYRGYGTNGGKHVFAKVRRSVFAEERDTHEGEIFDPSPS